MAEQTPGPEGLPQAGNVAQEVAGHSVDPTAPPEDLVKVIEQQGATIASLLSRCQKLEAQATPTDETTRPANLPFAAEAGQRPRCSASAGRASTVGAGAAGPSRSRMSVNAKASPAGGSPVRTPRGGGGGGPAQDAGREDVRYSSKEGARRMSQEAPIFQAPPPARSGTGASPGFGKSKPSGASQQATPKRGPHKARTSPGDAPPFAATSGASPPRSSPQRGSAASPVGGLNASKGKPGGGAAGSFRFQPKQARSVSPPMRTEGAASSKSKGAAAAGNASNNGSVPAVASSSAPVLGAMPTGGYPTSGQLSSPRGRRSSGGPPSDCGSTTSAASSLSARLRASKMAAATSASGLCAGPLAQPNPLRRPGPLSVSLEDSRGLSQANFQATPPNQYRPCASGLLAGTPASTSASQASNCVASQRVSAQAVAQLGSAPTVKRPQGSNASASSGSSMTATSGVTPRQWTLSSLSAAVPKHTSRTGTAVDVASHSTGSTGFSTPLAPIPDGRRMSIGSTQVVSSTAAAAEAALAKVSTLQALSPRPGRACARAGSKQLGGSEAYERGNANDELFSFPLFPQTSMYPPNPNEAPLSEGSMKRTESPSESWQRGPLSTQSCMRRADSPSESFQRGPLATQSCMKRTDSPSESWQRGPLADGTPRPPQKVRFSVDLPQGGGDG